MLCAYVKAYAVLIHPTQTGTYNTLGFIHLHSTHHIVLTLTVWVQAHMHEKHLEVSKCFYEKKEREARHGVREEKGGWGAKESEEQPREEAADQSWYSAGLVSFLCSGHCSKEQAGFGRSQIWWLQLGQ